MSRLTLEGIVAIEPRVADILAEAKGQAHRREELDGLYSRYMHRLSKLVGWDSLHKDLRTCDAYETIIKALCDALEY